MRQLADILEHLSTGFDLLSASTQNQTPKCRSLYRWVLENGLGYESKPLTRSELKLVSEHLQYREVQQCFSNCQQTVLDKHFLDIHRIARGELGLLSPFSYVEGYVLCTDFPIPIHHAWLLLGGKVVDPTLRLSRPSKRRLWPELVLGRFPQTREYYGSVISWRDVALCIKRNLAWHTVLDDWVHGHPLMQ